MAGITYQPVAPYRESLPPPIKSWRVPSMSHESWAVIAEAFYERPIVRIEYFSANSNNHTFHQQGVELAISLGVNIVEADYGVILEFAHENDAYQLFRYCMRRGVKSFFYTDGKIMVDAPSGLEFYLTKKEEDLIPRKRTDDEGFYFSRIRKVLELERSWRLRNLK